MFNSENQKHIEYLANDIDPLEEIADMEMRKRVAEIVRNKDLALGEILKKLEASGILTGKDIDRQEYAGALALRTIIAKVPALTGVTAPTVTINLSSRLHHDQITGFIDSCDGILSARGGRIAAGAIPGLQSELGNLRSYNNILDPTHGDHRDDLSAKDVTRYLQLMKGAIQKLSTQIGVGIPNDFVGLAPNALPDYYQLPTQFEFGQIRQFGSDLKNNVTASRQQKLLGEIIASIAGTLESNKRVSANPALERNTIQSDPRLAHAEQIVNRGKKLLDYSNENIVGKELKKIADAINYVRSKINSLEGLHLGELEKFYQQYNILQTANLAGLEGEVRGTEGRLSTMQTERQNFETLFSGLEADSVDPDNTPKTDEQQFQAKYKEAFNDENRFRSYFEDDKDLPEHVRERFKEFQSVHRVSGLHRNNYASVVSGLYTEIQNQAVMLKAEVRTGLTNFADMFEEIEKFHKNNGDKIPEELRDMIETILKKLGHHESEEKLKESWKKIQEAEMSFIRLSEQDGVNEEEIKNAKENLEESYRNLHELEDEVFGSGQAAKLRAEVRKEQQSKSKTSDRLRRAKSLYETIKAEIERLNNEKNAQTRLLNATPAGSAAELIRMNVFELSDRITRLESLASNKKSEIDYYKANEVAVPSTKDFGEIYSRVGRITASQFPLRGWRYTISSNMGALLYRNRRKSKNILKRDKNVAKFLHQVRGATLFGGEGSWEKFWNIRRDRALARRIQKYQGKVTYHSDRIEKRAENANQSEGVEKLRNKYSRRAFGLRGKMISLGLGYIRIPGARIDIPVNDPIWESANVKKALRIAEKLFIEKSRRKPKIDRINNLDARLKAILKDTRDSNSKVIAELLVGRFARQEEVAKRRQEVYEKENTKINTYIESIVYLGLKEENYKRENAIKEPDRKVWLNIMHQRVLNSAFANDTYKSFFEFVDPIGKAYQFKPRDLDTIYRLKYDNPNFFALAVDFANDYDTLKKAGAVSTLREYLTYRETNHVI